MKKMSFVSFFKDKTVTLLGLGLLGRGVGDAAFLARYCKKVFVTDIKNAEELSVSVNALKEFSNIEFFLGGHDKKLFTDIDFVIKGAGVRLDNSFILHAQKNNIPIYMSTALFAFLSPLKTIGVTGTRGKTTTTYMIANILKDGGKKIILGGNIRGMSTLALLPEADQYDLAVLELDSWQLQGFDDLKISPHIGVFTNFYPDHMNYYDGDMARYLRDKTALFRHQKPGDTLITTPEVIDLIKRECTQMPLNWIIAPPLSSSLKLSVPGHHNLSNAALAASATKLYGIEEATIERSLQNFSGIEGRLQFAGLCKGRRFYNDSNATTQEATLAALMAFSSESIVLIFGGADKGLPIDRLVDFIATHHIRCVIFKGTGSDRILEKLPQLPVAHTMAEAIAKAVALSTNEDNIILSPAFASFGIFKNEYDRSDQFMAQIKNLKDGKTTCPP